MQAPEALELTFTRRRRSRLCCATVSVPMASPRTVVRVRRAVRRRAMEERSAPRCAAGVPCAACTWRRGKPGRTHQAKTAERAGDGQGSQTKKMHKRLVALPSRQAAEHRRGGGREMVSISRFQMGAVPADDSDRPTTREPSVKSKGVITTRNIDAERQQRAVNDRTPIMDDAEVRASHTHPPVRCSGERARRPAGQVQANLGGARAHPRAGTQGRVLAAQGVRPPRGLSCQRSPATATIQRRALRRWSCSRARRRHSRRTSSDCTVQPSVGSPSRTRSCTS